MRTEWRLPIRTVTATVKTTFRRSSLYKVMLPWNALIILRFKYPTLNINCQICSGVTHFLVQQPTYWNFPDVTWFGIFNLQWFPANVLFRLNCRNSIMECRKTLIVREMSLCQQPHTQTPSLYWQSPANDSTSNQLGQLNVSIQIDGRISFFNEIWVSCDKGQRMNLTSGTYKLYLHLLIWFTIYTNVYVIDVNSFSVTHYLSGFPYKCIGNHSWPLYKKVKIKILKISFLFRGLPSEFYLCARCLE